ncbi:MAG: FAD-dependent oxidoreductase [Saprospiraceae bacterium]|nr:FAD-dependent oxidoreductase [Saprospiraceae bacterium]
MKVHVIGGGVIGLCSAYYLQKAGHEVTILDKGDFGAGCSFGNAGMIVPSHFVPLASPGVISKGLRWMFSASSPFYIRPRLDLQLAQWLWHFYRACTPEKVRAAMPIIRDLNQGSRLLYQDLSSELAVPFDLENKGLIMLFRSAKGEKEEISGAEMANDLGVQAEVLSTNDLASLEGGTRLQARGGVLYPGDSHLSPHLFMKAIVDYLKVAGVKFLPNTILAGWDTQKSKVTHIRTQSGNRLPVDQVVLAAGSWSQKILRPLKINMPIQDGKGYSVTLTAPNERPTIPSILSEDKVAITPMGKDLRFGGTLELGGMNGSVNPKRVQGIMSSLPRYYPNINLPKQQDVDIWVGFRPCSPDGLPYIGRSSQVPNLVLAGGHAMMGMSLGPITGKLIAEVVDKQQPSVDLSLLQPERYG